MQLALVQAEQAVNAGEVPVGAVLVLDEQKLAADHNRTISNQDPTAHAEILVLRQAAQYQNNHRLLNTTIYVTLEPCSMCAGASYWARLKRVVIAAQDQKRGFRSFNENTVSYTHLRAHETREDGVCRLVR